MLRGQVEGPVEPGEIERPVGGLEEGPGELPEMGELEAERGHLRKVALPLGLGPMLGIIIDADLHQVGLGEEPPGVRGRRLRRGAGRRRRGGGEPAQKDEGQAEGRDLLHDSLLEGTDHTDLPAFSLRRPASWPQAAAMSLPLDRRRVVPTLRSSSQRLNRVISASDGVLNAGPSTGL